MAAVSNDTRRFARVGSLNLMGKRKLYIRESVGYELLIKFCECHFPVA